MILDEKFWLAICFISFIALTYRPIKKAILGLIDRKIGLIRDELNQAKLARMEAEKNAAESKIELEKIIVERDGLLAIARSDITKISKEGKCELDVLLDRKERDAESRLEQLKATAILDVSKSFVQVAKRLTEDYLKEHKSTLPSDDSIARHLMSTKKK